MWPSRGISLKLMCQGGGQGGVKAPVKAPKVETVISRNTIMLILVIIKVVKYVGKICIRLNSSKNTYWSSSQTVFKITICESVLSDASVHGEGLIK